MSEDLVNRKTGKVISVPDAEVPSRVASGELGYKAGTQVKVVAPDGTVGTVPSANAAQAYVDGYRPAGAREFRSAVREAKYGDSGGTAFAAGAFDEGTLGIGPALAIQGAGLFDADYRKKGRDLRETFAGLQEVKPLAYAAGGIVGTVAPMVVSGGLGAAARAARAGGALAEGASLLGRGARAAGALTEGVSALGRAGGSALGRAIPGAAGQAAEILGRGAIEGAAYGAGHSLSEATLGDEKLDGERLLANIGGGALLGGIASGGMEIAGHALSGVGKRLAGSGGLAEYAESKAYKALGGNQPAFDRLGRTAEEKTLRSNKLGRRLLDEEIITPFTSREKIAEKIGARVKEAGKDLGDLRAGLDAVPGAQTPDAVATFNRIHDEVIAPLRRSPIGDKVADKVEKYASDFLKKAGASDEVVAKAIVKRAGLPVPAELAAAADEHAMAFDDLFRFRKELDSQVFQKGAKEVSPYTLQMRQVRRILEDDYTKAADAVGSTADFADKYSAAKARFADLSTAQKIAAGGVSRQATGRSISLTDMLAMLGGGANPSGLALGAANKLMREYGDQAIASLLNRATKAQIVGQIAGAGEKFSGAIGRDVGSFLENAAVSSAVKVPAAIETERRMEEVKRLAANPEALQARVSAAGGDAVASAAPGAALAMADRANVGVQFLARKLPVDPTLGKSVTPQLEKPRVSPEDSAKWSRYETTVTNPKSAVEDFRNNRITPEQVEALRTVYPNVYGQIQQAAMTQLADRTKPISFEKAMQLRVLLGVPGHAALEPKRVQQYQATYKNTGQAKGQGGSTPAGPAMKPHPSAAASSHSVRAFASPLDRIEGAR